jgi:hypothetical protein
MNSTGRAEPLDWDLAGIRRGLKEFEADATNLIDGLPDAAVCETSKYWRPHLHQILSAITDFRDLCREELEKIGMWREDGLQPDEVFEFVWDQADRLVNWLNRMVGNPKLSGG